MAGLRRSAQSALKCPPIYLNREQAEALLTQFLETARYRGWELLAVGIMANHIHLVVGVPGDPDPSDLMQSFKPYGSRALNRTWSSRPAARGGPKADRRENCATKPPFAPRLSMYATNLIRCSSGSRPAFDA